MNVITCSTVADALTIIRIMQIKFSLAVAIDTEDSITEDRSLILDSWGRDTSAPSLPAENANEADAAPKPGAVLEAHAVVVDEAILQADTVQQDDADTANEEDAKPDADAVLVVAATGKDASAPSLPADDANEADATPKPHGVLEAHAVLVDEAILQADRVQQDDAVLQDAAGMLDDSVLEADADKRLDSSISVQPEAVSTQSATGSASQKPYIAPPAAEVDSASLLLLYREQLEQTEPKKSAPRNMVPLEVDACDQLRQESAGARFMRAVQQTLEAVRHAMAPGKMPAWGSLGIPLPSTNTSVAVRVLLPSA